MSFALLAKEIKHFGTALAFDFKGHGVSKTEKNTLDFSIDSLVH